MERFYYDLDTVDGFSGGPVTDTDGKVIGIHSGTLKTDSTQKYCVRITEDLFNYFTSFTD